MTLVGIDVDGARALADKLVWIANEVAEIADEISLAGESVGLPTSEATGASSSGTRISRSLADVLRRKANRLESTSWDALSNQENATELDLIEEIQLAIGQSASIGWSSGESDSCEPRSGDPESDPLADWIGAWMPVSGDAEQRGRKLVAQLLQDSYDGCKTATDEFLVVRLDNGKYLVSLPGVTDLSKFKFPESLWGGTANNTARNTLGAARPSHLSTSVDDNVYAQLARDYIEANIPRGAEVVLVGHSYGADTALDLAADPRTRSAVKIVGVVAAGYHSQPQFDALGPEVPVFAFQNQRDIVVTGERVLGRPSRFLHSRFDFYKSVVTLDVKGAIGANIDQTLNTFGAVKDTVGYFADHPFIMVEWPLATVQDAVTVHNTFNSRFDLPNTPFSSTRDLISLDEGVQVVNANQIDIVFNGETKGVGHDEENYIEFVNNVREPAAADFLKMLGESGFDGGGSVLAVDVSIPG